LTRELSGVCAERNADPKKQRAAIERLIKAGSDLHETVKNGVTPLHFAVRFRNVAAVETLLRLGANVNLTCKRSGSTPLHRAVTWSGAPATAGKQAETCEIIAKLGKTSADYVRDPKLRSLLTNNRPSGRKTTVRPTRSPGKGTAGRIVLR
jgi:tankyrase